jgi:hypothetical protein
MRRLTLRLLHHGRPASSALLDWISEGLTG